MAPGVASAGVLAAAAAVLLVASGLAKLRTPAPTAATLAALLPRLRPHRATLRPVARLGGAVETALGVAFLAAGGRVSAALLAAAYLLFSAVAIRLLRTGGRASCGCFGSADAPIRPAHLVLDLVCLAAAVTTAFWPIGALGGLATASPVVAAAGCLQVVLLAALGYLAVTALPALAAARGAEEVR